MASNNHIIVGLGNPGPEYEHTRHNAGVWLVEQLAASHNGHFNTQTKLHGLVCNITLAGNVCHLLLPTTFMNHSGRAVQAIKQFYKIAPEKIIIVHDDLDLPPGTIRFKQGGGHGGHNGLRDIIAQLGTRNFLRIRLGIGHPGIGHAVIKFVLSRPSKTELQQIQQAIDAGITALPAILQAEYQRVMQELHS